MHDTISFEVAPSDGSPARLVVAKLNGQTFTDRLDVFQATRRRVFAKRLAEAFGLDVATIIQTVDSELPRLAEQVDAKADAIARQAMQHPAVSESADVAELRGLRLTDLGLAERFVRQHGDNLRYCHPWNSWLRWDGIRWRIDDNGEVERLAKQTVLSLYVEVQQVESKEERRQIADFALRCESATRRDAMLKLARSEVQPVRPDQLDSDPFLLGTPTGMVDLRTGHMLEPKREYYITKSTTVDPATEPGDEPVLWLQALDKIFAGDGELIAFLQRLCGYCLTGSVREHVLPIFHGSGRNGKSLILETILGILGDYGRRLPSELLLLNRGDRHPAMLAELFGLRLAVCQESPQGARLDESLVKELTGGDRLTARRMRENYFDFAATHKLILSTNHRPRIKGTDHAIWARVVLIPFNVRFWDRDKGESGPEDLRADKELPEKLKAEYPSILRWLIAGAVEWYRSGLQIPPQVLACTEQYRQAEDVLGDWLADCCQADPAARTPTADLWRSYERWCEANGESPIGQRSFGTALTERGYPPAKGGAGQRLRLGVRLVDLPSGVCGG
jgi:putative DNA primase/helicase